MKEHPIIFSAEMVRAILEGRKTQTRRVIKPQPRSLINGWPTAPDKRRKPIRVRIPSMTAGGGGVGFGSSATEVYPSKLAYCPYGVPGDRLWVRETHHIDQYPDGTLDAHGNPGSVHYRADIDSISKSWEGQWRPSIFMPRWASRILLENREVRVERAQDISTRDCVAEGISRMFNPTPEYPQGTTIEYKSLRSIFSEVWDSINAKRGGKKWLVEPWELWLWGRDEYDDPESITLDVRDPGAIQWRDPEELGPDYEFHLFRDSQPPSDGYYEVAWNKGSLVEYVYLRHADPVEGEDYVRYDYSWSSNPWVWVVEFRQI